MWYLSDELAILHDLDQFVHNCHIGPMPVDPAGDLLQDPLGMPAIVTHQRAGNRRASPHIVMVYLCNGDIEFAMQARQQGF